MERRSRLALLILPMLSFACSSNDPTAPPIVFNGPSCSPPICTAMPPSGAIAFEVGPDLDGGACSAPLGPVSLPEGTPAFDAITACGGNRSCGSADYRVTGDDNTTISCSVVGPDTFQVTGRVSSGGVSFDVSGSLSTTGGTVAINATSGDAGSFGATCTATTRVVLNGTIYADFTCPGTGTPGCVPKGTFVFENCSTE